MRDEGVGAVFRLWGSGVLSVVWFGCWVVGRFVVWVFGVSLVLHISHVSTVAVGVGGVLDNLKAVGYSHSY